jgi:DNA (cytosine-5)-methyltransferase 1
MGREKISVVDLFAGAGGFSEGFKQTGRIETIFAVENNKYAKKTFMRNHKNVMVLDDIRKIDFKKVAENLLLQGQQINIVIGGPPCQGFSNANRQKNELISMNNQLVKEYLRAIEHLSPDAFVMENVKMMGSSKHKFFYNVNDKRLIEDLELAHRITIEEFPLAKSTEFDKELINLIKDNKDIEQFCLEKDILSKFSTILRQSESKARLYKYLIKNHSSLNKIIQSWDSLHDNMWSLDYMEKWAETKELFNIFLKSELEFEKLVSYLQTIVEVQKVLNKMVEIKVNNIQLIDIFIDIGNVMIKVKTYNVLEFILAKLKKLNYVIDKGVLNAANFGVPQERNRLFIIGVKREKLKSGKVVSLPRGIINDKKDYYTIGQAIKDIQGVDPKTKMESVPIKKRLKASYKHPLTKYLNNSDYLYNHIITETRSKALERFGKLLPGQNFHNLKDEDKDTYTNPSRTQNTIYQRLNYNTSSGTVLNVRKSMWIHPVKVRAISIREAARLQSFPDSFVFEGTKDSQYQQIGNAVPPLLARAVAEQALHLLGITVENRLKDQILERQNMLTC